MEIWVHIFINMHLPRRWRNFLELLRGSEGDLL